MAAVSTGVVLKEGNCIFPPKTNVRADIAGIKTISRKLYLCKQALEALKDQFYALSAEDKENAAIQQRFWENVQKRILEINVFNHDGSFTELDRSPLPMKIVLPKEQHYVPVEPALSKEMTNQFWESKKFARELYEVVCAVKTIRKDPLFNFAEFSLFPSKDAFALAGSSSELTGEKYLVAGIYEVLPKDMDTSSEDATVTAIQDLVRARWDQHFFKKLLKKNVTLESACQILRELSRETSLTERVVMTTFRAASYLIIAFVLFSFLLFLTKLTPWNHPTLIQLNLDQEIRKDAELQRCPVYSVKGHPHRIIINVDQKSKRPFQVTGLYECRWRLDKISPFEWGFFKIVDNILGLSYEKPLPKVQLQLVPKDRDQQHTRYVKLEQVEGRYDRPALFYFKSDSREKRKWGRDIFTVRCRDTVPKTTSDRKVKDFTLELVVRQPRMVLDCRPSEIAFSQASSDMAAVSKEIRIYGNIHNRDGSLSSSEEVTDAAYMRIDMPKGGEKIPMQLLYTLSDGTPVVGIDYAAYLRTKKEKPRSVRDDYSDEYDDEENLDEEERLRRRRARRRKAKRQIDHVIFLPNRKQRDAVLKKLRSNGLNDEAKRLENYWNKMRRLDQKLDKYVVNEEVRVGEKIEVHPIEYYRPKFLPNQIKLNLKMVVKAEDLPKQPRKLFFRIAIPGIRKLTTFAEKKKAGKDPSEVPITFSPKTTVEYAPQKMDLHRDFSNGMAKEFKIQGRVWEKIFDLPRNELANFVFTVEYANQDKRPFPAVSLGLKYLGDPSKQIYFYNPQTGGTLAIQEYRWVGKYKYNSFTVPKKNYLNAETPCFVPVSAKNKQSFKIRDSIARVLESLFIVIATDKNVEKACLKASWHKQTISLPITAKSKETLRIVHWKPADKDGEGVRRYTPQDWLKSVDLTAPYGFEQVEFVVFSGDDAIRPVSDKVYLRFENPKLANALYQTADGDWFSLFPEHKTSPGIMSLKEHFLSTVWGEEGHRQTFVRADQNEIGKIQRYLVVPGTDVLQGTKAATTKLHIILPKAELQATLDIKVAGEPVKKMGWGVQLDDKNKILHLQVTNYPRKEIRRLTDQLQMLATCATTLLLHEGRHRKVVFNHSSDARIARTLRWSLNSIGHSKPVTPLPEVMEGMSDRELFGLMRENLFVCWSPQAQLTTAMEVGLRRLEFHLARGENIDEKGLKVQIKLPPTPPIPSVTVRTPLFDEVKVSISYDNLLFDSAPPKIQRFWQSYYSGIQKELAREPQIRSWLADFYPEPDAFPKQTETVATIKMSNKLAQIFKYSLWDTRLTEFNTPIEKLWLTFLLVTPNIGNVDGRIDIKKVNRFAKRLENELKKYFLSPISIQRVLWKDLKYKERNIKSNKDRLTPEEAQYVRQFTERALMSQLEASKNQCWYSAFRIHVSQAFFDKCPFGSKWCYIYTYLPGGGKKRMNLFRRDSARPTPWAGNYKVKITEHRNGDFTMDIEDCMIFQQWMVRNHSTAEDKQKPLILDVFYTDIEGEHRIGVKEAGQGPVLVSTVVHPDSILLYEVAGYRLSANYMREIINQLDFSGDFLGGRAIVKSEVGPVVVPLAATFADTTKEVSIKEIHSLTWQQVPPPPAPQRTFPRMVANFNFELLYIDTEETIKGVAFSKLQKICSLYDSGSINRNLVADLLEQIFSKLKNRVVLITPEIAEFYKTPDPDNMFQYEFDEGHKLTLRISSKEQFRKPEDFKGNLPEIVTNPESKGKMVFIWRITPKKTGSERGYPKYIVEPTKRLFKNKESVFFKEE